MTDSAAPGAFVIVGGGQAGAWIAKTLRSEGYAGRVVLIGDERHAPYERPPLSKNYLVEADAADGTLLSIQDAAASGIELWCAARVIGIDRSISVVHCQDGRSLGYERLFLATGGSPRLPPAACGVVSERLHVLRTRDDADRLSDALRTARNILIIGGGWIGLETAASCRALGLDVAVVEAADRLCERSVPPPVSDYLRALHGGHGVRFALGARCDAIEPGTESIAVILDDGRRMTADHVVVGVGISPNSALAEAAGLDVDDGIVVDGRGRTSDSKIFAAGDVTRHPSRFAEGAIRLESWANAQNQGIAVAKAALGCRAPYDEVPWIWSDQYGINLQILGLPDRGDNTVERGAPRDGKGLWLVTNGGESLAGIVAVNAGSDLRGLRKLVAGKRLPDLNQWRDLSVPTRKIEAREPGVATFA